MSNNNEELIQEVRALTNYHEGLISDAEMQMLAEMAINEVKGITRDPDLEIFEVPEAERAAFWSMCLFCKIHMGELDGLDFSLGEISVKQMPFRDITRVWYRQLDYYINLLRSGGSMGHTKVRRSDREYGL